MKQENQRKVITVIILAIMVQAAFLLMGNAFMATSLALVILPGCLVFIAIQLKGLRKQKKLGVDLQDLNRRVTLHGLAMNELAHTQGELTDEQKEYNSKTLEGFKTELKILQERNDEL